MNFKMLFFKPIVILQAVLMALVQLNVLVTTSDVSRDMWPCDSQIFCKPFSGILHTVQTLRILEDSKTFVDMPMKYSENVTLTRFNQIDIESKEAVKEFVNEYFLPVGTELVPYKIS